jgi:hypothetical protein
MKKEKELLEKKVSELEKLSVAYQEKATEVTKVFDQRTG